MPTAKIETAFLGHYTLVALNAAPDDALVWLTRSLLAWILLDSPPVDIPDPYRAAWDVIYDESERIAESMKESATARSDAAREAAAARWLKQTDADGCERKQTDADGCERKQTDADGCDAMLESKRESKRETSSKLEKKIPARAREKEVFLDDLAECPIDAKELEVLAAHIGMTPEEVSAWKDYYTAQGWRRWPNSPRPMTATAARAALRFWHTKRGIEAAREAHIDAKMDERHAAALAQRNGPPPPDFADAEERRRKQSEEVRKRLAEAEKWMP